MITFDFLINKEASRLLVESLNLPLSTYNNEDIVLNYLCRFIGLVDECKILSDGIGTTFSSS